jgi:hypothetical protein
MNNPAATAEHIRVHHALCEELLTLVERENQALREPDPAVLGLFHLQRQDFLPRFNASLEQVRQHRLDWQRLDPATRRQHPAIAALIRTSQDLIMKIVLLDRENEQARLRHGMLPPHQIPAAARQQPHYVTELYRRSSRG